MFQTIWKPLIFIPFNTSHPPKFKISKFLFHGFEIGPWELSLLVMTYLHLVVVGGLSSFWNVFRDR